MLDGILIGLIAVPSAVLFGYGIGRFVGWAWNKIDDWRYR